jgi:methylated-DNA-[protein]-cysteine S-methyltransferase
VEWGPKGLCALHLGGSGKDRGTCEPEFERLLFDLREYLKGKPVKFKTPLDLAGLPVFTRKVLARLSRIPFGKTLTYGDLASKVGNPKGARAVGQAVGRNPLPIVVPCHRVLAHHGGLGGFGAGLDWKRFLLDLEGIPYH